MYENMWGNQIGLLLLTFGPTSTKPIWSSSPSPKSNKAGNVISNNHRCIFGKLTSSRPIFPRRRPPAAAAALFRGCHSNPCSFRSFISSAIWLRFCVVWGLIAWFKDGVFRILMRKCWGCVLLLGCVGRLGLIGHWFVVESAGWTARFEVTCI